MRALRNADEGGFRQERAQPQKQKIRMSARAWVQNPLRSTKYSKGSQRLPLLYFDGRLANDEPCEFQSML